MRTDLSPERDLSIQIAEAIRAEIIAGSLAVGSRLPSEAELSDKFSVSRPTVREALKRLAAQNLIRTRRGASGGAFVNRISFEDAYEGQITTATLLLSMNDVDIETACEARFTLERACGTLAAARREEHHLARMTAELERQKDGSLSGEAFCASDVAFHRALVDGAGNPVLSYQLAGAVEAMQPLMNMITVNAVDRARITALHDRILSALENRDAAGLDRSLADLAAYTVDLAAEVRQRRDARRAKDSA
ncbi:MAG: GntR family transcriptional regulator [Pseudomonadota bacterium]